MSDLERRLHDALDAAVDADPDARGLAAAARGRARRRRRTTVVAAAAAVAVVAVLAVVVPTVLVRPGHSGERPVAVDRASDAPAGWHGESWRDVEVLVPDGWTPGNLGTWCLDSGRPDRAVVERPEGVVPAIGCSPQRGYGLRFFDPTSDQARTGGPLEVHPGSRRYPAGAWVGSVVVGHAGAEVVAPDRDTAEAVLGSVHRIEVQDSRGCVSGVYANTDFSGPDQVRGPLTVCRYTGNPGDGEPGWWLAQSTTLSAAQSAAVREAVAAAPTGRTTFTRCQDDAEFYLLTAGDGVYAFVYNARCGEHQVITAGDGDLVFHQPTGRLLELLGSPYGDLRR
jgi:hypothetical protein